MNKEEFLAALGRKLTGLPAGDIENTLCYYAEMIDDAIEDGASDEEAVASMGSVDEIAAQTLAAIPLPKLVRERVKPNRALRAWEIILLILGSPLWLTFLLVALSLVLTLYCVIWAIVLTVLAAVLTLAVGVIAGLACAVYLLATGEFVPALLFAGATLVVCGAGVLAYFVAKLAVIGTVKLSRLIWLGIKSMFVRKDGVR